LSFVFKPFGVKFTNEKLNQQVTIESIKEALKNKKINCNRHDDPDSVEVRNGQFFCKNCETRLRLIPAWISPE